MRLLNALRSLIRWHRLNGPEYHHFRRLIIPTSRGSTEIDHLIVSPFGLFVVELKDRSGWIFGNEADAHWTAAHFREKFRFQNPLHQNYGHVKALQELLGVGSEVIHSLVVFRGTFEFKTPIPAGVLCHDYSSWIAAKRDILLDQAAVDAMVASLEAHALRGWFAARRHARSVRARYSDDTTCPKCDGELVIRTARKGPDQGSRFLGCANYPACKYKRTVRAS